MAEPAAPAVVTCRDCGWVSTTPAGTPVPVDGTEAPASCWRCGGRRFREYREGDCPTGATLNDLRINP